MDPVLDTLQLRTDEEQATLLAQVDFSADLPELVSRLVDAGGLQARTEAVTRYLYPDTGYIGSYADYLAERRAALEPIREQATEVQIPDPPRLTRHFLQEPFLLWDWSRPRKALARTVLAWQVEAGFYCSKLFV